MIERIETIAMVGAGYMGGGIAQSLAAVGHPVQIADLSPASALAARTRLIAEAEQFESAGMWPSGSAEAVRANLAAAPSLAEAVADADFIEEAVFEVPETKREVLAEISRAARPDAIIGTNTSTIPVGRLADAVLGPERFLTVHFSNPAPFIPGVELVVGAETDPAVLPPVRTMLAGAGRQSAVVADRAGFVLNRLQFILLKEAAAIVEEGTATAEDVDTIVRSTFGFRLPFFGPFAIADMAGLDVYANGFRILEEAFGERFAAPRMVTDAVEQGRHGMKSGAGITGEFSPERTAAYVDHRTRAYGRMARLLGELGEPDATG